MMHALLEFDAHQRDHDERRRRRRRRRARNQRRAAGAAVAAAAMASMTVDGCGAAGATGRSSRGLTADDETRTRRPARASGSSDDGGASSDDSDSASSAASFEGDAARHGSSAEDDVGDGEVIEIGSEDDDVDEDNHEHVPDTIRETMGEAATPTSADHRRTARRAYAGRRPVFPRLVALQARARLKTHIFL